MKKKLLFPIRDIIIRLIVKETHTRPRKNCIPCRLIKYCMQFRIINHVIRHGFSEMNISHLYNRMFFIYT